MSMNLQAVIFDFDGIIVNSEPLHLKAFNRVLEPLGLELSWSEYCEKYLGFDDRDVFRERYKLAGKKLEDHVLRQLMRDKAMAFVSTVEQEGVDPYPGVIRLVRELHEKLPVAICSGALLGDIEPILNILGLQNCFTERVTADQVQASKPDPESYRMAYNRLAQKFPHQVTSARGCVAIEDTPAGILAAKGAGMNVLAVTNTYEVDLLEKAAFTVHSLEQVDFALLQELAGSSP